MIALRQKANQLKKKKIAYAKIQKEKVKLLILIN